MYTQPMSHAAVSDPSFPHIEVTGSGTVIANPDSAVIVLGAVTENVSLSVAQTENAKIMSNIIQSLSELGIPKEQMQTVKYRIDPQYDYKEGQQIFRGYQVTHLLQITMNQVNSTGLVVDTAVQNGANTVTDIQFKVARPETYYQHALAAALKNAEGKALTLTNALGVQLVRYPMKIVEETGPLPVVPYQTAMLLESAATPIQPGELEITAALRVQYSYLPLHVN